MRSYDNTYSRFIALAKVLLPIAALAILSTIFLISRNVDPTASIPFAQVDVEQLLRDQGVSSPVYASLSGAGTAINFQATRVLPSTDETEETRAEDVRLLLSYPDGVVVNAKADQALFTDESQIARLSGAVEITTSEGWTMTTRELLSDLESAWLRSADTVNVTGPFGELVAGKMDIHETNSDPVAHVVDFIDGVKLIYTPQPDGDPK
ncbi:LPS export ABC transporter periplasmic protein LptC [Actibacterium pelagium]|uniref:Lipopolysaccharide export system protein LptC n=1 Tax=Actibacterium pelagium TaxID=2029103 RepID=A0A917AIY8_9RHOB|nr:LPS export ABC transporter periplasmic protein LptC [Actibacterium pelagium]GGE56449.1 hypothetical protein GCM10011517_25200 [Actibacterium pelagium]